MTIILGYLILLFFTGNFALLIWAILVPFSPNRHGILWQRKPHTRAAVALFTVLVGLISLVMLTNGGAS